MIKEKMTTLNGFYDIGISSKEEKTSVGYDGRIKFGHEKMDLHNYCEDQCKERCGLTPSYDVEDELHCEGCDCVVSGFYNFTYKLALVEDLIRNETENEITMTRKQFAKLNKYKRLKFIARHIFLFTREKDKNKNEFIYLHTNVNPKILYRNYRFDGLDWYTYENSKVYVCKIPKDHKLVRTIEKYFKYRILN